jgi:hypothetical protein
VHDLDRARRGEDRDVRQTLEQVVLDGVGPGLMSKRLGSPPLLILFAVLAGAQVAGTRNAVRGIPVLSAALEIAQHVRRTAQDDAEPGHLTRSTTDQRTGVLRPGLDESIGTCL